MSISYEFGPKFEPVALPGMYISVDGQLFKVNHIYPIPSLRLPFAPRTNPVIQQLSATVNPLAPTYTSITNPAELVTAYGAQTYNVLFQLWFKYINFPVMVQVAIDGAQNSLYRTSQVVTYIDWDTPISETQFFIGLGHQVTFNVYNPFPFPLPDGMHIGNIYAVLFGYRYDLEPVEKTPVPPVQVTLTTPGTGRPITMVTIGGGGP